MGYLSLSRRSLSPMRVLLATPCTALSILSHHISLPLSRGQRSEDALAPQEPPPPPSSSLLQKK
eukprot:scaffold164249_cov23-Tisochrysis_lutea.AAC.1